LSLNKTHTDINMYYGCENNDYYYEDNEGAQEGRGYYYYESPNESKGYSIEGEVKSDEKVCEAIYRPIWVTFDSRKRNRVAWPDINEFEIVLPKIDNMYNITLREVQYPVFASLSSNDYFNLRIDAMPVIQEAVGSTVTANNLSTVISDITLQLPNHDSGVGSGSGLWDWENSGMKPGVYDPRQRIQVLNVKLVDYQNELITTGASGSVGPPMRLVFAIERK